MKTILITLLISVTSSIFSQNEIGRTYKELKKEHPNSEINDWIKEREENPNTDAFPYDYDATINLDNKTLIISNDTCVSIEFSYYEKEEFLKQIKSIRYDSNWVINEWGLYQSIINKQQVVMLFSTNSEGEGYPPYQIWFKVLGKI